MKKLLAATLLTSALTLGPASVAHAQTDDTSTQNEDDDSGKLGLIGLAGLLGLAGLARRDRTDRDRYDDRSRAGTGTAR
jgi:MYXO-CTERM domain-containing protein